MVTKEQAMTANEFHDEAHHYQRWRRNGKTQTWVTRPDEFKIPVKFGLYQYGYITELNAIHFHVAGTNKECHKCL